MLVVVIAVGAHWSHCRLCLTLIHLVFLCYHALPVLAATQSRAVTSLAHLQVHCSDVCLWLRASVGHCPVIAPHNAGVGDGVDVVCCQDRIKRDPESYRDEFQLQVSVCVRGFT